MAYKIIDRCDKNGTCKDACPLYAIAEGATTFVIDPELCVDCGACTEVCPLSAIEPPQ